MDLIGRNKHMVICLVNDFSLSDLLQPVSERFKNHLSAIINYYLFKDVEIKKLIAFKSENVVIVLECRLSCVGSIAGKDGRSRETATAFTGKTKIIRVRIIGFCDHSVFLTMYRSQKQEDREKVIKQKKINDELKEEVLKMNYEQQRLREQESLLKIDVKSLTQRIVWMLFQTFLVVVFNL